MDGFDIVSEKVKAASNIGWIPELPNYDNEAAKILQNYGELDKSDHVMILRDLKVSDADIQVENPEPWKHGKRVIFGLIANSYYDSKSLL